MSLEIKYKSWNDITINKYYEILDILNDDNFNDTEKNLNLIAALCDVEPNEVYNTSLDEVTSLLQDMQWVKEFNFPKELNLKRIKLNNELYNIVVNADKWTTAQFIDFQTFYSKNDLRKYYGNLLACIIIPKGKRYNEGYDIVTLGEQLRSQISIYLANTLFFSVFKECLLSLKATQIYSRILMKKMMRKAPKEERERLQEIMERDKPITGSTQYSLLQTLLG